ncbi:MAG: type II toxin-antitoxin system HicA family toxin [Xanthobacteraceae bacterium]
MNERLPALTARDVMRALARAGFAVSRTSGSHCRLIHRIDPARKVTVPVQAAISSVALYVPSSRRLE